jgi:hypothetical protein
MTDIATQPIAPVLLIAFNRPDLLQQVIEPLNAAQPSQLFLALDGPREGNKDDVVRIQACAELTQAAVSRWRNCRLTVLRRTTNLGMKRSSIEATTWFLNNVGSGVVLEDDCVVDPTFLAFSSELLVRYADDLRVMAICAQALLGAPPPPNGYSYRYARTFIPWGMATWKRSWDLLDPDLSGTNDFEIAQALKVTPCSTKPFIRFWRRLLQACREGRNPGWSFPWALTIWKHHGLCIVPSVNLVSNIGHGEGATMTHDSEHFLSRVPSREIEFPLRHPSEMSADCAFDRWSDRNIKGIGWSLEAKVFLKRLVSLLSLATSK